MDIIKILITFIVGIIGWQIAKKIKLPAPAMIGSLIAVGAVNVIFHISFMPRTLKIFTQSVAGAMIGIQFKKSDIKNMKHMIKPILLIMVLYTVNTFICGTVIHYIANIDLLSSWLSCVSGGVTDISLIAMDLDADLASIVFLQSARLIFTLGCFPYWIKFLSGRFGNKFDKIENTETHGEDEDVIHSVKNQVITYIIALICGFIGSKTGIPAGTIIFAMAGVCVTNNLFIKLDTNKKVKTVAQIFSGSIIGCTITLEMVIQLRYLFIPIIVLMLGYLSVNALYGYICAKNKWLDYQTALFCSCPAGVSDMVLLSGDLGADMKETGTIHIIRLIYAIALMPNLIVFVNSLL